jgi:hypothetical protein
MQASQDRKRQDLPTGILDRRFGLPARYALAQSLVRPPDVEIADPLSKDTPEMVFPQDNDVVETLAPYAS